jgi:SAM-dependent methyltransferase
MNVGQGNADTGSSSAEPGYDYRGMVAASWDLLRGDTSGWPDRACYLDLIRKYGEPVLDVGCGTGRLLLDYLAQGVDVDGVDDSPEMLALCRTKAADAGLDIDGRLHQEKMEALELPRRYRTILVPSSSFQLLTDPAAAKAALIRFHDHLLPGGCLVMSFMVPGIKDATSAGIVSIPSSGGGWSRWRVVAERVRPEDGATIRRSARVLFEPASQLEHEENRYEVITDGRVVRTEEHRNSPATRWYTQEQALAMYWDAGFADVHATSGFSHEPAKPDDTLLCVLGTRR